MVHLSTRSNYVVDKIHLMLPFAGHHWHRWNGHIRDALCIDTINAIVEAKRSWTVSALSASPASIGSGSALAATRRVISEGESHPIICAAVPSIPDAIQGQI
jgi:hypothetical protein